MRTVRWCITLCAVVVCASATGQDKKDNKLPDAVLKALEKPGELEVYSLDGEAKEGGDWHKWRVLGKTTVKADDAKKAAAALKKGVEEGESGARCFIPRHGIRVVHDKKTYDFVICFECRWVYVFTDANDKPHLFMISESPQKPLNAILTAAKVPLAKPEKPEKPEK